MTNKIAFQIPQGKALFFLPYGVLVFLFLFFASPTSKIANVAFYLLVMLPALVSVKSFFKNKQLYTALRPIFYLLIFWALFSFVSFDHGDWYNVAKRFRHAAYVFVFVSACYYLLTVKLLSIEKLILYIFCLAISYSLLSFIYYYVVEGHSLTARLFPILGEESPIYMAIILTVYGVPLLRWLLENNKNGLAFVAFFVVCFFVYFYNSRSAIASLTFGVFIMVFLARLKNARWGVIFLLLLLVLGLVVNYLYGNILNRGISYRVDIWESSIAKAIDCNIFVGCGLGGNSDITIESGRTFQHSHNIFLSHLINTGLFGLTSLLSLLGYVGYQGLKLSTAMVLGLLVGVAGLFFDGNYLVTNPDALWFIFWLPLTMTYWEINQKHTA